MRKRHNIDFAIWKVMSYANIVMEWGYLLLCCIDVSTYSRPCTLNFHALADLRGFQGCKPVLGARYKTGFLSQFLLLVMLRIWPLFKMTHEGCHQLYACNLQMLQDARKPSSVCLCFFLARCMLLVPRTSIITNSIHDVQLFCCLALFALDMFAHGVCYEACRVVGKLENQKNTSFVLFRGTRPRQPFPASGLAAMLPPCSWGTHVPMGTSIWKDALQTNPPQAEEGTTANTTLKSFEMSLKRSD